MSLELPGYVVTAFNLVGLPWPGIDEDVLRSWANDVRRFAAQVHDTSARSHGAVAALAAEDPSPPAKALLQRWDHYHGVISELRGPMDAFAGALDVAADAVVAQKGVVIGAAVGLAAAFVATQGEALFTFGLAEAEVPAEVAATRLIVKAALQELEGMLLGVLINTAANEIAAHLGPGIAKLVTGGGEVAAGAVSAKATYDAAKTAKLAMALKKHQDEVGGAGSTSLTRSSSRQLATGGPGGGWREVAKAVEQAVLRILVQLFRDLVHAISQIIDDTTAVLKKMVGQLRHMNDERPPKAGALTAADRLGNEGDPGTAGAQPPRFPNGRQMQQQYRGEHIPGNSVWPGGQAVQYLNETERQALRLTVRDGRLYDASGKPFDTSSGQSLWSSGGRAIFVMDKDGNLYASNYQEVAKFHHSSILAGQDVAGAGELQVANGRLEAISDRSGHYQPTQANTWQVVNYLRSLGVPIDDGQIEFHAPA